MRSLGHPPRSQTRYRPNGPAAVKQTLDLFSLDGIVADDVAGAVVAPAFTADAGGKPTTTHDVGLGSSDEENAGNSKLKIDWESQSQQFHGKDCSSERGAKLAGRFPQSSWKR